MISSDKPLLIVKTGCTPAAISARRGDFEQWITTGLGLDDRHVLVVDVANNESLPLAGLLSGVVITGAPAMVTERSDWMLRAEDFVKELINHRVPTLGICFGHQLIAQALGGVVGWHPRGREIGTTTISLSNAAQNDALFAGSNPTFPVHVTHMQSVLTPPPGAIVLASNDFESHHGLRFAEKAWGLQFHPEFDEDIMAGYLHERRDDIRREGQDPDRLLAAVAPTPESTGLLRRFSALCGVGV